MKNKTKTVLSYAGIIASLALLIFIGELSDRGMITQGKTALITASAVLVIAAAVYAAKVDYETGVFECRECGHTFKPTVKAYIFGEHTIKKRRLKCPACEQKTWCLRKPV